MVNKIQRWQYFKNWGSILWLQRVHVHFKTSKHSFNFSLLGYQLSKRALFSAILGRTYILAPKIDQHLLKSSTGQNWQNVLVSFCSQLEALTWKHADSSSQPTYKHIIKQTSTQSWRALHHLCHNLAYDKDKCHPPRRLNLYPSDLRT